MGKKITQKRFICHNCKYIGSFPLSKSRNCPKCGTPYMIPGDTVKGKKLNEEQEMDPFIVKRKGWFVPKGKKNKFYVYTCDWQNHPRLINKFIKTSWLPVSRRQKIELAIYLAAIGGVLYFIYLN